MAITFSLFEVALLIGITQGFVMSGLLGLYKRQFLNKRLLLAILLVFNLLCIKLLIHTTGLWKTPYLRYFPLGFELAIQPLIWFYVNSLVYPAFRLTLRHWFHFLPFALSLGYAFTIYLATLSTTVLHQKDAIANGFAFNSVKQVEEALAILSAVTYWLAGAKLIRQYRRWLFDKTTNTDYPTYTWLIQLAWLFCLLIGLWVAAFLPDTRWHTPGWTFAHWQVFFLYLAALVYYLGFRGYGVPDDRVIRQQIDHQQSKSWSEPRNWAGSPTAIHSAQTDTHPLRWEEDAKQDLIKNRILWALQEKKLYLDPELSIQKLADELGYSASVLSKVINRTFGKSFRTLINEYRVEAVKDLLSGPPSSQFSLAGIGFECGFNSEASFYRIFKSFTGVSPKVFAEQKQELT
ncbi:helix-turn-helix domain-containing protein [Spirosoma radiotolerans]|uniref:HTH araC/xylS-type domain-containing protein n=1 Tax=Spirosoma radiotolerans TaxID=1379870 RepID=A0A0E3V698_9BACT|nr:helix-turn-helix transcriptional regulator [Spirosoma radiotolerans]AKD54842.1 hypothetical protein SD10_07905 [Spirosoma radiotolerans]